MNETNPTIRNQAFSGMLWSSGGSFAFQLVRILTQVVLARLLWPEAFGLVALAMAFVSVANYLIENGMTLFLIRKKDLEPNDAYSLFFANNVFALSMMSILVLSSGVIATWLGEAQVGTLLAISSVAILFSALGSVHKALLTRDLAFRGQAIVLLISALASGSIAIVLSFMNFGVWSLVLYNVLFQLIQTMLIVSMKSIRLTGQLDRLFLKEAVFYSWKLMVSGLFHTIYENIFNLIMGGLYSTSILGYYSNALKIRDGAAQTLTDAIQRVSFPVLSKLQDQMVQLIETNRRILKLSIFVIFPILFGLAATSDSIVRVVFTEEWLGMIPVLQILAFNGLLIPLHKVNLNLLTVVGRTDLYLRLEIIKKIVAFITIALGLYFGVSLEQLLWILFINAVLGYIFNVHYTGQLINYGYLKQLRDIGPILVASGLMGLGVALVPLLLNVSAIVSLALQILVGGALYIVVSYFLARGEFMEVWILVKRIVLRFRRTKGA